MKYKKTNHERFEISGIDLWTESGIKKNQIIVVENGSVKEIKASNQKSDCDWALIPIGVDPQVHLRVPGQPEKETPDTGLAAALLGGVGAILTMPNTKPVIDSVEILNLAKQEISAAEQETQVKVLFSAAITLGQRGQSCVNFKELAAAGAVAFTDDGVGVVSDQLMEDAFKASSDLDLPILQHAEFPGHGGIIAPSTIQESLGVTPYSDEVEVAMVERDLKLLSRIPSARYHVLHVSSARTVQAIERAKERGLNVSCEVSPHHLWFSVDDISSGNSAFKMNPPLRSKSDRAYLRKALEDGLIDFVATDHAPHEPKSKTENFKTAAFGTTGLETALRVLLSLYARGELSAKRLVQTFSTEPAKFLRLKPHDFGRISVGDKLRACLVDLKGKPAPVKPEDLVSLSKNSCFLGSLLNGQLKKVFIGKSTYEFTA